ncbi:hypothetical protein ACJX0J_008858, partial [Zea mays]
LNGTRSIFFTESMVFHISNKIKKRNSGHLIKNNKYNMRETFSVGVAIRPAAAAAAAALLIAASPWHGYPQRSDLRGRSSPITIYYAKMIKDIIYSIMNKTRVTKNVHLYMHIYGRETYMFTQIIYKGKT